jgi:Tol biopolymer transport system component
MSRLLLVPASIGLLATAAWLARSPDDSALTPIPGGELRAFGPVQPRLSPAGDRIVFSCQAAIWVLPASGGTMTRLTSGEGFDTEPTWSPDGQRIAYLNGNTFGSGRLRVIRAEDGTRLTALDDVRANGKLAFHPDGRRLLASLQAPSLKSGEALAWVDLTTGQASPVTDPPRAARRAALSGDGRWIAWATHRDVAGQQSGSNGSQADLWKVSADGGSPEKVGEFPARIFDLCWTTDGSGLIVSTDLGGAHNDLWQVPLDHPERGRRLTSGQADEDRPSLSRDGRRLLYTDNREGSTALVLRDLRGGDEQTLTVTRTDYRLPSGTLKLRAVDKASGATVAARVTITDQAGKFHAPLSALYRIVGGQGHFYGRDTTELRLPAGDYRVTVFRGPEYRPARQTVRIEAGQTTETAVVLERWVEAASFQLYSGESHIHANYGYGEWYNSPETMLLQCEGEDLHVCNFMVANSDGDGVFDRTFFRGRPDPLSKPRTILYWNEEYRSTIWGHMTLLNLRQVVEPVFTGFKDTTNPYDVPTNADTAERTRQQGGLVNYTHAAADPTDPYLGAYTAKGLPVDAALGKVDTMDLNLSYSACVPLWYRLLNCGFRLPPSAGTDVFLNRILSRLPGSDRVYVRVEGDLTYAKWIDGLRAGHSFVTNGPFLELRAGPQRPGDVLRLAGPGTVKVTAKAWAHVALHRAELVHDGQVIATRELAADGKPEVTWEQEVPFARSGWLALRASGPSHADNPGGPAYAHTSPIFVDVADRPPQARSDAQYFLKWIDRLELSLRERNRFPGAAPKDHALAQLEAARKVYAALAGR